ncbi:DDT domain superfamily [Artemisia annua]|uniref:DDT domain superfamily n=1 Tax=Artemisia annua TaxID=35608 RepID=A0A2U1NJV4_ARTAN|nr:DDT domain superfamily [Artemisia annua]
MSDAVVVRRERPSRACTARSAARIYETALLEAAVVFRPLLNIKVEFSVEELETALITPNSTLGEIHMPLLKAIPPVARMALGQNTWVTVLCRKLKYWWHWVSEEELPIVSSQGAEIDTYNTLDPAVRVLILKALCDIRVEQDDIRSYIDDSIKNGVPLSAFRKERTGGDSHGVSFWYEDDPIIGQRLYREIRKVEVKGKGKNVHSVPSYQWETVATNLDEFLDVSEKLFSSINRMEASLGKKLKNDMLPEIEKVQKRKEKLLKKQHREALLLEGMILDDYGQGRSLRGRKQVSYTFDDYDRSISDAIKITKAQPSLEPSSRREGLRHDSSTNGRFSGDAAPLHNPNNTSFSPPSPDSLDYDEGDELDRSNRTRQRPQRYSARELEEAVSDNEGDKDSDYNDNNNDEEDDDDIVGEAVYNDEYLKKRKAKKKMSSGSEGDEEYQWDGDNIDDEEEEESLSASEESDDSPQRFKKLRGRTRRDTKLKSVNKFKGAGPRRSRRAARNRIDYKMYEFSESEPELEKPETSDSSDKQSEPSDKSGFSMGSSDDDTEGENNDQNDDLDDYNNNDDNDNDIEYNEEMKFEEPVIGEDTKTKEEEQNETLPMKLDSPIQDEFENGGGKRRFLDLNELAPGSGFEDGPIRDDDDLNNF